MARGMNCITAILSAVLLGGLAASALSAQSTSLNLVASIPFDFSAGSTVLPAGEYSIRTLHPYVVEISSLDNRALRAAVTTSMAGGGSYSTKPSQLVFQRYGSKYYLHQVWREGAPLGYEMRLPKHEKSMLVATNPRDQVVIAARR